MARIERAGFVTCFRPPNHREEQDRLHRSRLGSSPGAQRERQRRRQSGRRTSIGRDSTPARSVSARSRMRRRTDRAPERRQPPQRLPLGLCRHQQGDAVTWEVDDIDTEVETLRAKGVAFDITTCRPRARATCMSAAGLSRLVQGSGRQHPHSSSKISALHRERLTALRFPPISAPEELPCALP